MDFIENNSVALEHFSFAFTFSRHTMDEKKRNKKRLVRVDWDDISFGKWHYVSISDLKILPGSVLEAGGRVRMRHNGKNWTGTIGAKKKRALAIGK